MDTLDDCVFVNFRNFDKLCKSEYSNQEVTDYNYIMIYQLDDLTEPDKESSYQVLIPVDLKFYLNDLKRSFKGNETEIHRQFECDYNRMNISINNHKEPDLNIIKEYINYRISLLDREYTLEDILMILTQASIGLPFEIVQKGVASDYYIAETKQNDALWIDVIITDNKFTFNMKKRLRIFIIDKSSNDKTLCYVNIEVSFDILNDRSILIKSTFIGVDNKHKNIKIKKE
jgi:hypothetical protein